MDAQSSTAPNPIGTSSQSDASSSTSSIPSLLSQLPVQAQRQLAGMNKDRLQQIVARMQQLKASGATEQSNAEYAGLVQTLKAFQYIQQLRMQQLASQQQSKPSMTAPANQTSAPTQSQSQPQSQPQPQSPASAPAPNVSFPGGSGPALSNEQLSTLRHQIGTFKQIAHGQPIAAQLQNTLPEHKSDESTPASHLSAKVADAAADSHAAFLATNGPEALRKGTPLKSTTDDPSGDKTLPRDDPSSPVYPYNAYVHPFTMLAKPSTKTGDDLASIQQRMLIPSLLPAGIDARLLLEERDRFVKARIQQRIRELESFPSTMAQVPIHSQASTRDPHAHLQEEFNGEASRGQNAKVKALIELKSLHLLERQQQLREKVVASMQLATTLGLDRSAFRRVRKQALRDARVTEQLERKQRTERERKAKQRHTDYLSMICTHGKDLLAAHNKASDQAKKIGRMVLKLHADTDREEQKRVERIAKERLNALKADDEEAYLKLIDTAKDTRITHLLQQTDAYLDNLAQAVQAQQNDEAHADFHIPDKRVTSEGGVDETTFGAARQDDPAEDTGRVDYYSVAHRYSEKITEQPSILVGGKLKDYQMKGLQWMVSLYNNRLNGILADEMGLGKTIQTISLITFLIESKKQNGPYLVIVPLSTLTNWVNEFNKWAPSVSTLVYKGTPSVRKQLAAQLKMGTFQVLLTTYEYIIKEKNLLGKIKWTFMIIDEGHRMKNTQSKLTVTLTQNYYSRYRLLLTGTPLQNNLPELWALLNFVLPKIFNSIKSFDEWFNTPFVNTGSTENSMRLNEEEALLIIKRLHKVLRPFLLRRLKKDVESELPDKVEKVVKCRMSALQAKLYQQMKKHKMIMSDVGPGAQSKPTGIRGLQNAIMQLRKICNHPYAFEQVEAAINPSKENGPDLYRVSGKFELLDRILPKLFATGHRVLIFFQMTAIMDIMEDFMRFRGIKYLRLDGSTKPDDRSILLREFNKPNSEYDVFILSTRAGGLGLNLQSADTVIIYDSDWNPHQDLQAQDRAHRIGQKVEVRILRLVTEKSVEETILSRAQSKLEINGKVIQAGKFDNQATADERELLLRAMLEADNEEEDEEERGDWNDDDLNELLARSSDEVVKFQEVDRERAKDEEAEWYALGNTGPVPERLMQESELPEMYRRDFAAEVLEGAQSEQPLSRRRNVVHYDDGLTEDQFLRALEGDQDLNQIVERKRERAEKRRLKQAAITETNDADSLDEDPTGTASPIDSPMVSDKKRKGGSNISNVTAPSESNESLSKRRKVDENRDAIKTALWQCYKAVEQCEEPDTGRRRCALFLEIPKKSEYPDYHVLIPQPIALRQIRKRIESKAYKTMEACRDDFHLMFNNARTYNQEGSLVWNDAEELQQVFDQTFASVQQLDDLAPKSESEFGESLPSTADTSTAIQEENLSDHPGAESQTSSQKTGMKIKLSMAGRKKRTT